MAKVETVKVQAEHLESGYMVINKADFDESKHKLFGSDAKAQKQPEKSAGKKSAKKQSKAD